MKSAPSPFQNHPELEGQILDPLASRFRDFDPKNLDEQMLARTGGAAWRLTRAQREACRADAMQGRWGQDLWVFAYGSLMWDPGFVFSEIRRARAPQHARRFILRDTLGARGSEDAPGVMAALDSGDGCDGLAFRIQADLLECETEVLWRRERAVPAYCAEFAWLETELGAIDSLVFVADHSVPVIDGEMSWDDQVRFCALGKGFLGTSLEYAENLQAQCDRLGIHDTSLASLVEQARSYPGPHYAGG